MQFKSNEGQNAGPPIMFPRKQGIRRYLVTDQIPNDPIKSNLEKDDWIIVSRYEDWNLLPLSLRGKS
jgi:hypothetical protein